MKKIVNRIIIPAVVAATAALLLAGCQEGNGPSTGLREQETPQVSTERRKKIVIDTIRLPRNDAMGWRESDR